MKIYKRLITVKKALLKITGLFLLVGIHHSNILAQMPDASFTSDVNTGCSPLTVNFTNQSTLADLFFWDFGNGNTSTLQNPTTVYVSAGNFTVTLIAINSLTGNRDTAIAVDYIFVPINPVADFIAPVLSGCTNNNAIAFTNLSVDGVSYIWDFGDGNSSTLENPVHTYTTPGVYTVKLITSNLYGCTNVKTQSAYITIYQSPTANFTVNQQSTCDQNSVFSFSGSTAGATSWFWDFGDGNTSTAQNPAHSYTTQGAFNVTLIVANANGCTDTVSYPSYINIGATLVPSFTVNSQAGCAPLSVSFNSTVSGATSWTWLFGDGNTSNVENPAHTYTASGTYDITLNVTTVSGCNGSVTLSNFITVDPLPVVGFNVNNSTGCAPHTVNFTNSSSGSSSWLWDFGNGVTSTLENPSVIYGAAGNYSITLTSYSANGCSSTLTLPNAVTVNTIDVGYSVTPRIGCAPLSVSFNSNAIPPAVAWSWDFGNGNTSSIQSPTNIYNSIGTYNVQLIVTSADGCKDTLLKPAYVRVVDDSVPYTVPDTIIVCTPPGSVSFLDPTIGSNGWLWNFGDGDTSNLQNPSHTYTVPGVYTVTLASSMAGGCSQLFNPYAIINVLPFVTTPIITIYTSPCGPYTVHMDNLSLDVDSYLWDFGDGTTSTLQNPVHTYAQPGTYQVSLLLTALNGCQTTLSTIVSFGHDNPILISDTDACLGDIINFSLNPISDFSSATWDFGDGNNSTQLEPAHIYSTVGVFPVSVTVIDTDGCVYTYDSPVDIIISNPVPSFTANLPHEGCIPFDVQFVNTSIDVVSYLWDFGDGNTSTLFSPAHTYTVAGVYPVSLTGIANGCSKNFTIPDFITANDATADFSFTPQTGCLPLMVNYTDLSVSPVSWLWEFGDGATSSVQNPVHVFNSNPALNVQLTVTDINGCTKTKTYPNINPVIPVIIASDTIGCRPMMISFSTPTNAVSYLWDFGDGSTSMLQNPTHLYTQAGIYTVTLTCILASGCSAVTVKPDYVNVNAPITEFMTPTVSVCAPSLVNFINQSIGATTWLWDFGDGTSSTNENPSHIYNIPGSYTVSLISYTPDGCPDTLVKPNYIVVPGTYSEFTLASGMNCLNTVAEFIDLSINATSWFWNFGDGFTSTLQNPTHLYADTGSYVVTLITSDNTGCSSFYSSSNPIVIHPVPTGNAVFTNSTGCEPLQVSFTNSSSGSLTYTWHFGNGDTSAVENPVYTYSNSGNYLPFLIAHNNFGCSDTFSFLSPVVVNPVPVADFIPSSITGCTPLNVSFNNSSTHLSTPSYQWNFDNGLTSAQSNPVTIFTDAGNYNVTLIVINTEGCSDTVSTTLTINQTPVASGIITDSSGCAPHIVNFNSTSQFAATIQWDFGDGNTSALPMAQHQYLTAGNYFPELIAVSVAGCADTSHFSTPVAIHPVPEALFTVDQTAGCPGNVFQLTNQSSPAGSLSYNWNIAGVVYTSENPSVVLNTPGFYDVGLIVTTPFGCTDTLNLMNMIQVFDTVPPLISPILSVSVINNTDVEIIWMNNSAIDLGAYVLYRRNNVTGIYDEIYRDNNPSNSSINVSSSYIDTGLNTLNNVYTYKLQTEDLCAYEMPFSSLIPHTTINITATAVSNNILVNWTPYIGCQVASYELNRINLNTGATTFIGSFPPNILTYFDADFVCPHQYSYKVTATDLCGNPYTSLSDTSVAVPENMLASQRVEIVRSTVIDDRSVLTEWLPPALAPQRVKEYKLMRSTDNIIFEDVAVVGSNVFSYIDNNTNVHSTEYYYKIEVISDCEVSGTPSNNSSSILLQSIHKDEKTKLWWTPYNEWDAGVDYYIIEQLNRIGQWERIKQVQGTELETILD